jgi:DNA mismatch endonuclease (patch repair protein)
MSANRAKDTRPELCLRRELRRLGITGYRLHVGRVPGRPDITFWKAKVAVFVHGCFWHRCPHCRLPLPKTHTDWWGTKFEANQRRDKEKARLLREAGWRVLTLWECELSISSTASANRVKELLNRVMQGQGPPADAVP